MDTPRPRLDQHLVDVGLAETRTRAQGLIMAGLVDVAGKKVDKAGTRINPELAVVVRGQEHPWVSRGGLKLMHGLESFAVNPNGLTCLDVGASTGGFTDVLLTEGAARVYAVDVGYGQLAHKLRVDPRVVVLERTNARHLTVEQIPEPIDLLVCDASFINLRTVLSTAVGLVKAGGGLIALIKPQFEAGRDNVGKGGVVRDPAVHQSVCDAVSDWLGSLPDWTVMGIVPSPIKGPEGNLEFLMGANRGQDTSSYN